MALHDHPWLLFGGRISETLQGGLSDVSYHVRQPCRYAQTGKGDAAEDALFSDLNQSEGLKFVGEKSFVFIGMICFCLNFLFDEKRGTFPASFGVSSERL